MESLSALLCSIATITVEAKEKFEKQGLKGKIKTDHKIYIQIV
jgi:hypothetical protein